MAKRSAALPAPETAGLGHATPFANEIIPALDKPNFVTLLFLHPPGDCRSNFRARFVAKLKKK